MWHVSTRSGVATLRTAIHLLLTYLLCAHFCVQPMREAARRAGPSATAADTCVYVGCCVCPTWNWVIGPVGQLGHLSRPGHRVVILTRCETRVFPVFEKKLKIKIYIFVKIRPTVIEILTFNK